jgi:hypothetical protein
LKGNIRFLSELPFNSPVVETGNEISGILRLFACAVVDPNELNNFTAPSGTGVTLNTGQYGGSYACIGGIWSRFAVI